MGVTERPERGEAAESGRPSRITTPAAVLGARPPPGEAGRSFMEQLGASSTDSPPPAARPARDAARVMYDALTEITRADVFFEGERRLKRIAVRALEKVEALSKEQS
jgi:hypothetical protein